MKHFRLYIISMLIATASLSAAAFAMYSRGAWPQGTLLILGATICGVTLVSITTGMLRQISAFLKGILARDTTMRFDFGKSDALLAEMADDMNSIATIYRDNNLELETSKLYYDRILTVMTHEMRNYVAPILAITSDIDEHPANYPTQAALREIISLIHRQSDGIKRFLDSYYRLTHLPAPEAAEITAKEFVGSLTTIIEPDIRLRRLAPGVCRFEFPRGMTMRIDTPLLTQVMLNLLRNALDAVKDVGNPRIDVIFSMPEGNPYITVSDNGCGIPQQATDNLFMPFYTTKDEGCGVGLTISRQIVRRHGGDLWLSHGGHPTVFAMSLP